MMKKTAIAPANIAFIKYWGKRDVRLNLPTNGSISMNLSAFHTITTVAFNQTKSDQIFLNGIPAGKQEALRISAQLDRIRSLAQVSFPARISSKNNFPTGVGIASSASGFAALTLAASRALGLRLSKRKLSILARRGSGSACRSIPDGFVEWIPGTSDENSYARSLYPASHWDLHDLVVLVSRRSKKVGSSEGHSLVLTSPFFEARLREIAGRLRRLKQALGRKDFRIFGEIIEEEALNMHAVMMTSKPALFYLEPVSLAVMHKVVAWREEGLESYFTLDAGPTVHIICQGKDSKKLAQQLKAVSGVMELVDNEAVVGARVIEENLF